MKLHLIILASLLNLAMGGFMVELTGSLTAEPCPGEEDAAFKQCLPANVADEDEAVSGNGGERALITGWCSGCQGTYPKGHFCFTVCGPRRRLEEGTSLRHLEEFSAAVYNFGVYNGHGIALDYAKEIINCLETVSANHLCLGNTTDMNLVVFA
jgi:hypothetical protein